MNPASKRRVSSSGVVAATVVGLSFIAATWMRAQEAQKQEPAPAGTETAGNPEPHPAAAEAAGNPEPPQGQAPPSATSATISDAEPRVAAEASPIGSETCLSCHADREAFKRNIHGLAWPKAKGIDFSRSCETCHGPGSLHAEAAGDKNNPGYWTIRNASRDKGPKASQACLQCHQGGARMHWAGSTHDAKNVSCLQCHSIHNETANAGKPPLLGKKSIAETCYQCHAEKKAQIRKSGHMPLVEGKMGCNGCHNPHGSPAEKLLAKNNVMETCFQCHQDKRGPFLWDHAPAREGACLTCHDPHGSHNEKMLVTRAPMLCQRCHVGGRHPATAYGFSGGDQISNRLTYKGCVNCHFQVHGSNHPSGKFLSR